MENLYEAWLEVRKNKGSGGVDGVTIEMFEKNLGMNLREIQRLLQQDRYKPDPVLRHYIEKENGKLKPLGIPTIRDRVIQQAVRRVIEPIFEQDFYYYSFGFRPGYSAKQALTTIRRALNRPATFPNTSPGSVKARRRLTYTATNRRLAGRRALTTTGVRMSPTNTKKRISLRMNLRICRLAA
jgi:hypothetical protein